jgi:non-reducing end alpha-L-arabinofuranosidase
MKTLGPSVRMFAAVLISAAVGSCTSSSPGTPGGGSGVTGSGGATGSGGLDPDGGTAGSGGDTGSGGVSPTGGADGSGGDIGSGGVSPTGGNTGSGGGAGIGGSTGSGGRGAAGSGGSGSGGAGGGSTPCSILAGAGNACVAAHSTVRVIFPNYAGPLYQVCKGSFAPGPNSCPGGMTKDVGSVASGYADSASQDAFCSGGTCTVSIIYDQSPMKNDLNPAPAGGAKGSPDNPVNATDLKTTLNGHAVYGVFIKPGMGYRAGCTGCGVVTPKGTATGDQPETEYMVTSQKGLIDGCCFDYGNGELDSHDDGKGTMDAIYFGGGVIWGTGAPGGHNNGPWVMADIEDGLYAGWENNQDQGISTNTPLKYDYLTAILVGDTAAQNGGKGRFALYGGDATGGVLKTMYDGIRPSKPGYVPMHKQGSIILGIGGDNSGGGGGQWFEGVMANGAATRATLNALHANVVAAGYGK